jgi:hypothetical protein
MKAFHMVHDEIMGTRGARRVNETVVYLCSRLYKALDLIRKSGVVR